MTQRRRNRRIGFAAGLAASVLLAAVIGTNLLERPGPGAQSQRVATVERQSGNIFVHDVTGSPSDSKRLASDTLLAGQVIATAPQARLTIDWLAGESIRIDENTRLIMASITEIELLEGRIYVDSHSADAGSPALTVRTANGLVRHLGTQYMAGIEETKLSVSVREGQVMITSGDLESIANPGEQLSVTASGAKTVSPIPTFGELWDWTAEVTPKYMLDGRSAFEFIQWVSRESGRRVSYATPGAESLAHSTMLRGSIELAPLRALDLILQTSDLVPEIRNGNIIIRKRQEG